MQQYLELLKTIKKDGTYKPAAREGMPGTQSLFGYQFRHDLSKGFPLLTTKKMFWKGVVIELLWFLRGDTNIKYLVDNGVNIWNEDAYNYYCKITKNQKERVSFDAFLAIIKHAGEITSTGVYDIPNYSFGDCGFQYGRVWRNWSKFERIEQGDGKYSNEWVKIDQIENLINGLKTNPMGRRHIVTAWDPAHDNDLALTWCHAMFQFNCRPLTFEERATIWLKNNSWNEKESTNWKEHVLDMSNIPKYYLDCQLYQRSADVVLGVPFNLASYALLTHLVAKITNMIPGEYIHTFGDVHIYDNHKEAVEEQLLREPKELPTLHVLERHSDHGTHPDHFEKYLVNRIDLDQFLSSLTRHDFRLEGYEPHPKLESETILSTGLVK